MVCPWCGCADPPVVRRRTAAVGYGLAFGGLCGSALLFLLLGLITCGLGWFLLPFSALCLLFLLIQDEELRCVDCGCRRGP